MPIYEPYTQRAPREQQLIPDGGIVLRKEQRDAVEQTKRNFRKPGNRQQLWNAKMRFGKTLSALTVARELNEPDGRAREPKRPVRRTIIITQRPVVREGWGEDFPKVFNSERFIYETDPANISLREQQLSDGQIDGYLLFASIQYLRLTNMVNDGVRYANDELKARILGTDWDLVIVDEAHEGTTTELGQSLISTFQKEQTNILYLSGTSYNLFSFFEPGEIFTWDYLDEQRAKANWKPEDGPNPYEELPRMKILTYDLDNYFAHAPDAAHAADGSEYRRHGSFSFSEFFRVNERGTFAHEADVEAFLDLMCREDDGEDRPSNYPFSREEFRSAFSHTLWVLPGVKECRAMEQLLQHHDIFSSFDIVNVAGELEGDGSRTGDPAYNKLMTRIGELPALSATITLTYSRLTTGVTVRPWTAVLYMKGTDTRPGTYLQTIFRVQSPDTLTFRQEGLMKAECYVFDFAPERARRIIAENALQMREIKGSKTSDKYTPRSEQERDMLAEWLNFMPIVALDDSRMVELDVDHFFDGLNSARVDRIVTRGFNDDSLYNIQELLGEQDIARLNSIGSRAGRVKGDAKDGGSPATAFNPVEPDQEQKRRLERARKKEREKQSLTEEERQALQEEAERRRKAREEAERRKQNLRGVMLRIPLMIFGARTKAEEKLNRDNLPEAERRHLQAQAEQGITLKNFADIIDDRSWAEFMPRGITRDDFRFMSRFVNATLFNQAGRRYRELAAMADEVPETERVARIAEIHSWFHNPDKETVLTPWRVVNRHLTETIGGYRFTDEAYQGANIRQTEGRPGTDGQQGTLFEIEETFEPELVSHDGITDRVYGRDARILELNSKTGLYPLYVAYTLFRVRMRDYIAATLIDPERAARLFRDNSSRIAELKKQAGADERIRRELEARQAERELWIRDEQVVWDDILRNNLYIVSNTPMAAAITRRTLAGFRDPGPMHIIVEHIVERLNAEAEVPKLNKRGEPVVDRQTGLTVMKKLKDAERVEHNRQLLVRDLRDESYWARKEKALRDGRAE